MLRKYPDEDVSLNGAHADEWIQAILLSERGQRKAKNNDL